MRDLLSIGTSRGCEMIGIGVGLGLSGYRLPSSGFIPTKVSGLSLWLDASDNSTLLQSSGGNAASADGDPVGYWQDKSGNGRNLAQTDGTKKPSLKVSVKNTLNVVRFDGVNDFLTATFSLSQPAIYFVVSKRNSLPSGSIVDIDGISTGGRMIVYSKSTGQWSMYAGSAEVFAGTRDTSWHLHTAIFNDASSYRYVDNSQIATGNPGTNSVNGVNIGANNTGGENLTGDIAEILIYSGSISSSDRTKVSDYLNAKWSIY